MLGLKMNKMNIFVALLLASGVRTEWSWGKNGKAAPLQSNSKENTSETSAKSEIGSESVGRSYSIPAPVLPLEEHSSYAPPDDAPGVVEESIGEEGRSGRFLGISDKLCKLGVKGMCEEHKGYPPVAPSHYENTLDTTYTNYPSYAQAGYVGQYPNTDVLSPKPLKKIFNNLFNKKKLKGAAPQQTYGVPSQTYFPPSKAYSLQHSTYKQPTNSYIPPSFPTYSVSGPKPHYVNPKPTYSVPKPSVHRPNHFSVFDTPKPNDVVIHKVKGQHSIPTHHISGVQPTKVEHIHTHTHIYNQASPFDIRDSPPSFSRGDVSSYQATSHIKTVVDRDSRDSAVASNSFPPFNTNPTDSFKPSQPIPFSGFPTNHQDKRESSTDGFALFGAKQQQAFQSSIDKLANSFANNGLQRAYPVDCQCVQQQYCALQDLVARANSDEISHLLDARNQPSEVLSNGTFYDDYFDYDYLRTEGDQISESANATNATSFPLEEVHGSTEEVPTTAVYEENKKVRRSVPQEEEANSTVVLEGRQLTGFTPGIDGCGHDYVCCQRPVYIAAKRSQPVCGRGNPSIHGRVSSFQFEKGQSDFGEYPWQAAILRDEGLESMFVCGATLIDDLHILTAAHCVNDLEVETLKVRLGEWDVNRDTEFYKYIEIRVSGVFVHPDFYKGNLYNDIAILRLAEYIDVERSPHISPICLPAPNTDFTNYRCHVTGWGKDAFGDNGKFQHILKELEVLVVDHQTCENALQRTRLGREYALHDGFICAGGEEGKDACKGDGGGPLVCSLDGKTFQLGGIVSWGIGCGQKGVPGVYVNIPYYVDWIKFTIRI